MAAIITSIINWKGGVGKTTLAHHLGTGLTHRRKSTLLIDLDPQGNLSLLSLGGKFYTKINSNAPTVRSIFESFFTRQSLQPQDVILKQAINSSKGNVYVHADLILSHPYLEEIDMRLSGSQNMQHDFMEQTRLQIEKVSILKRFLDQVADSYDYIFIDCPASTHLTTQNAIFASDYYIVPALPHHLATVGISGIRNKIDLLNQRFAGLHAYANMPEPYTPAKFAGVIFNMVREHAEQPIQAHMEYIKMVENQEPSSVFKHYLIHCENLSTAATQGVPLYALKDKRKTVRESKTNRQISYLENIQKEFMIRTRMEETHENA